MKIVDVSIVTANYNNSKFLNDFFNSILDSTYYPKEIIFVDDCSTDDSLAVANSINVPNLKIISLEKNVGFANALNIGIDNVTCKYILRIDPDDMMDTKRIELQYNFLENNPDVDLVGSNSYYYNDRLKKVIGKTNFKSSHHEIFDAYKNGNHGLIHGTILCKSKLLDENRYLQANYPAEEYDIFSRIILNGGICHNLSENLLFYRIHGRAVSNKMPLSTIKKMNSLNEFYFNKKNNFLKMYSKFIFLRNYRLYLFHFGTLKGYMYLLISALANPISIKKRFTQVIYKRLK